MRAHAIQPAVTQNKETQAAITPEKALEMLKVGLTGSFNDVHTGQFKSTVTKLSDSALGSIHIYA
ncbi:MAG: hypothetical protein ABIL58_27330 [Pseudomonadota bacterium]